MSEPLRKISAVKKSFQTIRPARIETVPVAAGAEVDVEVTVDLRLPYMQIAPMTYVTNHAANRRTLAVR